MRWIFENQGEEETYFYQTLRLLLFKNCIQAKETLTLFYFTWVFLENLLPENTHTRDSETRNFSKLVNLHDLQLSMHQASSIKRNKREKGSTSETIVWKRNALLTEEFVDGDDDQRKWLKIRLERTNEERRSLQIPHQAWYLGWALGPIRVFSLSITMLFVFLQHTFIFNNSW